MLFGRKEPESLPPNHEDKGAKIENGKFHFINFSSFICTNLESLAIYINIILKT